MAAYKSVGDDIGKIWRAGEDLGLSSSDIHNVFTSVFREEKEKEAIEARSRDHKRSEEGRKERSGPVSTLTHYLILATKLIMGVTAVCVMMFAVISLHNPTRKFVTRNIQDMIYPVMTRLRYMALPLLSQYPELSVWYSEECLLPNPFFDQPYIDCVSCHDTSVPITASGVNQFRDLYYNNGKVVIVTDALLHPISWTDLADKLDIEQEVEIGALKYVSKSETNVNSLNKIMKEKTLNGDIHIEWKVNRLETLHVVRKIFPRLYFIPSETEVALYRFLFVDGPESNSYQLPLTEFANVVLIQGDGSSNLTLYPSQHCQNTCSSVTVTLNATQVLFFNWIYWRPVRVNGKYVSTLAMSSFY
nr:uncharacterized protein LOC123754906 [Procambarus clarkii]